MGLEASLETDPPPTSITFLSKKKEKLKKKKIRKKLNFTGDIWFMTQDRWGEVNLLSKFQIPSFIGLGVEMLRRKGSVAETMI